MIAGVVLADRAAETVVAVGVQGRAAAVDGALLDDVSPVGLGEGRNAESRNAESGNTGTKEERDATFPNPKRQRGVRPVARAPASDGLM